MRISSPIHYLRFVTAYTLLATSLSGCIGSRSVEAPPVYLSPAGWQNNERLLSNKNFAQYASAVREEVKRYRLPFAPENAEHEVELVSPLELPLGTSCNGQSSGIAILVHGLSDTAFSLRDIGGVLAESCFKSRLVLLPGHGTRAGDLLTTRHEDWQKTLNYLIDQAVNETDTIILIGFSLGGVLTLDAAVQRQDDIDGIIGISPAYYLSSARLAKWANLLAPISRWVDRGVQDDPLRYEAMPTRGVAETWSAMTNMHKNMEKFGPVKIPWMLTQSMDDAVVVPEQNELFWKKRAKNPNSQLIRFVSTQQYLDEQSVMTLPGSSDADRVIALTHLAIHQSPVNPHYGKNGTYRNCGGNMPREQDRVKQCEESEDVWYGLWDTDQADNLAMAFSTFNPSFDLLANEIKRFASRITAER